ncbi:MAG TPA: oligosaccharide flippase family protein [Candidatus Binataceae bacterium]|nr:oligosaccharide flippase family protein [Candidatus Binataceae bacterium]
MSAAGQAQRRRETAPPYRVAAGEGVDAGASALRHALVRSLSWVSVARAISGLGAIVRYVVFARLLTPFDFGVVGAASFFEVLFQTVANPNFERALVAETDAIEPYLDTVWVTMLAQGAIVALALAVLARPLAAVFRIEGSHRVFVLVAPIALLIALKSPASTGRIYRGLDFRISAVLNLAEVLASLAGGVAGILVWRDWRGLVIAMYCGHLARTGLSYGFYPYRPRLRFDPARARRMFAYGRWVTVRSITEFVARNLDNLAVGHLLGPRALGEYQMAFRIGEFPPAELANGLGMVSFPVVARLRTKPRTRDRLFGLMSGVVALFGIAYATSIFRYGPALIAATVGAQWIGALAPLRLLCIYGMFAGFAGIGTSFLDGLGVPAFSLRLTLISAATLAVLVYPLTAAAGASGAALAIVISAVAPMPWMLKLYVRANEGRKG